MDVYPSLAIIKRPLSLSIMVFPFSDSVLYFNSLIGVFCSCCHLLYFFIYINYGIYVVTIIQYEELLECHLFYSFICSIQSEFSDYLILWYLWIRFCDKGRFRRNYMLYHFHIELRILLLCPWVRPPFRLFKTING